MWNITRIRKLTCVHTTVLWNVMNLLPVLSLKPFLVKLMYEPFFQCQGLLFPCIHTGIVLDQHVLTNVAWHALEHWYVGVDRFSWNTGISALYLTGMMWYVIVLEFMIDIAIPLVLILSLYFLSPHMLIFPLKFNNVWDYTPTAFFYLRLMSLKINCWRGWLWNYLISSALFS